eukprot:CAMPEP_0183505284 /NCGR_PEP_ID=MMETSP0371-20130417/6605_1 /TAXON_ID=268820 /ORGANISM="Peridinium aciculiferum, Strain PAER-2" /LENGTH=65 /DNA_ID=CAMNT_0025700957 /DNA_START=15 /DNA_END=208 /DNA_ORIENTATION=+
MADTTTLRKPWCKKWPYSQVCNNFEWSPRSAPTTDRESTYSHKMPHNPPIKQAVAALCPRQFPAR